MFVTLLILATFVLTTASYVLLLFLAFRRVAKHLHGNPEAIQAVIEHVWVPLFGKQLARKNPETSHVN